MPDPNDHDATGQGGIGQLSAADRVVVIGAGPAGLTAAFVLGKHGRTCTVLEADDQVGGISRTVERDGYRFDIGGHRFFSKSETVRALWTEMLAPDCFLRRPRLSRILYRGQLFEYPLKPFDALRGLGIVEALRCVGSYAHVRIRPPADRTSFEGWTTAAFGHRLYRIFFKTYTEKVWGVPANEIRADWAAQRIKSLNLARVVMEALRPSWLHRRGDAAISLIDEFDYPEFGPGQMWEHCHSHVADMGSDVRLRSPVVAIRHHGGAAFEVVAASLEGVGTYPCSAVISSMPITQLVQTLDPLPPREIIDAAKRLRYRDFLTVALIVPESLGFPDNWIYVHDPSVRVGRVQNFGAWSPSMVRPGRTCLGLEYFVNEGDDLWCSTDRELVALATEELGTLGLVRRDDVEHGYVVRMPKAYPMYDATYAESVGMIRGWLERNVANVIPVGRNGMHRYNNQDHSMLTAVYAVENLLGAKHDLWEVNLDDDYHEELPSKRIHRRGWEHISTLGPRLASRREHTRRATEVTTRPSRLRRRVPAQTPS